MEYKKEKKLSLRKMATKNMRLIILTTREMENLLVSMIMEKNIMKLIIKKTKESD